MESELGDLKKINSYLILNRYNDVTSGSKLKSI